MKRRTFGVVVLVLVGSWVTAGVAEPSEQFPDTTVTVSTGDFYFQGFHIPPPYVLAIRSDTLYVNGYRVYPRVKEVHKSEAEKRGDALMEKLMQAVDSLRTVATNDSTRKATLEKIAMDSGLVESAHAGPVFPDFGVKWKGTNYFEALILDCRPPQVPPDVAARDELKGFELFFGKDCLIMIGGGQWVKACGERKEEAERIIAEIRSSGQVPRGPKIGKSFPTAVFRHILNPPKLVRERRAEQ